MQKADTEALRLEYARRMLRKASVPEDPGLLAAMAAVPREHFLGPPPWQVRDYPGGYSPPSDDLALIYDDVLVALDAARGINNGSPSLHARGIHALAPRDGDHVVHIGAGTGYYSAILAEMVGPAGRVWAVEYDQGLAERARACLADRSNVETVCGNGSDWPDRPVDIVYVNFATDRPADRWVEMLRPGGRLLFPLGVPAHADVGGSDFSARAGYLLVTATADGYAARFVQSVAFIWGRGLADAGSDSQERLAAAFRAGGALRVAGLRWKSAPRMTEWFSDPDWGLELEPVGEGTG